MRATTPTLLLCLVPAMVAAQDAERPRAPDEAGPRPERGAGGRDRRRGQRGGPGGGFGGMRREVELVERFDADGNGWLDAEERKPAREFIVEEREAGRAGRRGFGRGPRGPFGGASPEPPQPGPSVSPADVEAVPDAPLYDPGTVRTLFLDFESDDWEKELEDFSNTDVDVPARLTVDGVTYEHVGVHFRGASSLMTVGEGFKRSLNLSLDFIHDRQRLEGYRTLNLLNSHSDPTFLRTVLFTHVAREYIPAPKANFVRVVINGESWGVYINAQQFNKDFIRDWFETTKGARWKAPGSPRGRASFAYVGDDPADYKGVWEIKSRDDPEDWAALIQLCKVIDTTPPERLEAALEPLLDIDGALKFLALDVALVNNDGYWTRTSDYNLYRDRSGRFHVIPHDANETFRMPGGFGRGRRGGPGGFARRGFPGGGFPGFGGFGRGMTARSMLRQGDADGDGELTRAELTALGGAWFKKMDVDSAGSISKAAFTSKLGEALVPAPEGPDGARPPVSPDAFIVEGIFKGADANEDGAMTGAELEALLAKWFDEWSGEDGDTLDEESLARGLREALPRPAFGAPPPAPDERGPRPADDPERGRRGPPQQGRGDGRDEARAVELDPLVAADDPGKPLFSKLLAVPSLRKRYLAHVRDIAERWLDWERLGPIAERYHALIADEVRADTRKLDSTEAFLVGLTEGVEGASGFGGRGRIGIKEFAEKRRAYLLEATAPDDSPSED